MSRLLAMHSCKKAVLLILGCFSSAVFAQQPFTIKGSGKSLADGDKIYLVYKVDGKQSFDSTTVNNHIFLFNGTVNGIGPGYLTRNENPMTAEIVHGAVVYIEQGDIRVTSDGMFASSIVSGTTTNHDYHELATALRPLQQQMEKLNIDFESLSAEQKKDINVVAAFREHVRLLNKQMEPIQFEFVKSHPNSYISLETLNQLKRNVSLLGQVNEAYTTLSPALKQCVLGKSLLQSIEAGLKTESGIMAMDFVQPDVDGKLVKLSDFKGKYVLVDFWASWCAPCRAENPYILTAYHKFNDKGFTVLSVSLDDQKKAWLKAIKDDALPWTQVSDLKGWKNGVTKLYGIQTIPANVLIDPSGKIVARNIQDKTLFSKLEDLLGAGK